MTLKSLLSLLKERDIFKRGKTSLSNILHRIGFRWEQSNNRRALFEPKHLANKRIKFLQEYVKNISFADILLFMQDLKMGLYLTHLLCLHRNRKLQITTVK